MTILRSRETIGYTLSLGFIFGCLLTYIASAQQIFQDIYGIVTWFPAIFASVAGTMVLASLTNSLLVERVGMRRLSHGALISLVGTILIINVVHALVGVVPVALFVAFLAVCFYLVGIMRRTLNTNACWMSRRILHIQSLRFLSLHLATSGTPAHAPPQG